MALTYASLDKITRQYMLKEFQFDINGNTCFLSKRFNDFGNTFYVEKMPDHILNGNDDTLAEALKTNGCFNSHEERKAGAGVMMVKVPITASITFSEGEFNRFYIRGLCLRALEENMRLEVYRARNSSNPRPESEELIGSYVDPNTLLQDLRDNKGIDTALGLPSGPNSGLSVKLI